MKNMAKKTLIIGASTNPGRYAYIAAHRLVGAGHDIINIGVRSGEVAGQAIEPVGEPYADVDTITLYVGPARQPDYYDYILATNPKRIIFNPGTENPELEQLVREAGIEPIRACTLVMLSTGQY